MGHRLNNAGRSRNSWVGKYCILEIEDTLWTVENIFVRNAESIFIMKTDWGANGRSEKWQYFRTIEHLISNKPHYTIRHRDKGALIFSYRWSLSILRKKEIMEETCQFPHVCFILELNSCRLIDDICRTKELTKQNYKCKK